jgi:glycerophosphoryl diester phosphodiesterase
VLFVPCVAGPLIIAHRGASAEKPENTFAAFRRAIALGADGIELDVHVTRDGIPVVFHDDDLRRLTGTRGRIDRKSWAELKRLRVAGTEVIPRLVDVLRLTRQRVPVQIEIKAGVPVAPVVDAITRARGAGSVILASFDAGIVSEAAQLAPTIPRMLITEARKTPAALLRQLTTCGAAGVSVNWRRIRSAAWVRYFQDRGHIVWCWTVNDVTAARRLAEWGVDGLLSDDPALLRVKK